MTHLEQYVQYIKNTGLNTKLTVAQKRVNIPVDKLMVQPS